MKKQSTFLITLILLMGFSVYGQKVSGKVTSEGSTLPGVSVLVKGTSIGGVTDLDGFYSLDLNGTKNGTLIFSFIGFVTQEIPLQERSVIDVALVESIQFLNEIVITALNIPREAKTLVYATQQVKPTELFEVRDANNVLNSLQGKITNALITQGSGGPGSGARIVLRGNRFIQGSNNALIVVDGVPITNITNSTIDTNFGGLQGSDGASNINPDDIESMTILRGASAAALYGSAAGNGVIVITTKKGAKDRVSVTINSGVTSEKPFVLPNLQDGYGQGNSGKYIKDSGFSWGPRLDGSSKEAYMSTPGDPQTRPYSAQEDNVKDFFRTGVSWNNSIGVSGGSEKMQTYLSYTNNHIQGIQPRNDLNRHTVNLRVLNNIGKKIRTDAKLTYILQNINNKYETGNTALNPILEIYKIPRNVSLIDAQHYQDINNVGVPVRAPYPVIPRYQNPYWTIYNTETNEVRNRIMGFMSAQYDITDWLKLSGRANMDKYTDKVERSFYAGTVGVSGAGGSFNLSEINVTQYWFDAMLEGKNTLSNDFKIDYRLGAIFQDNQYDVLNNIANGLNVTNKFGLNFATNPSYSQDGTRAQTQSVFGQVNLAYKEAIFLDASLRNDWDSRLPFPYSFSYPSLGISAILSDMIQLPRVISLLKVSGNYAEVGNGGKAQIRFNTYNYSQGAGNGLIARSTNQGLANIKPEIVKNIEFGIDARFLHNRLGFEFIAYRSNSFNQLLTVKTASAATGFLSQYINAGNIENKGLELLLNAKPVKGKLTWDIAFNLGMNRNKVISLHPLIKQFILAGNDDIINALPIVKEGGSYGDMLGFFWMKDANGNYLVNTNGTPLSSETTGELGYIGNFNPKATLGFTNTFNYKSFSLRLLIDGRIGGTIVDGTEMFLAAIGIAKVTSQHRDGDWVLGGKSTDGSDVTTAINSEEFWTNASQDNGHGTAEFYTYDATNFRVRELSLGYQIPVPSNFFIRSARFSLIGRNVLFLYRGSAKLDIPGLAKRKMGFDPDMALGNGNWQGVSFGAMPSTRSIGFNVQLTF